MKNNLFVSICALILISACQPAAEPAADMEKVKIEIQNLENAWADAMNVRDVDALMALYADDAVAMGGRLSQHFRKGRHPQKNRKRF